MFLDWWFSDGVTIDLGSVMASLMQNMEDLILYTRLVQFHLGSFTFSLADFFIAAMIISAFIAFIFPWDSHSDIPEEFQDMYY